MISIRGTLTADRHADQDQDADGNGADDPKGFHASVVASPSVSGQHAPVRRS
jgi:hypothetical protein